MDALSILRATAAGHTTNHPDYAGLPDGVKLRHTEKEFAWLGDEERARIIERETMPDMDVIE